MKAIKTLPKTILTRDLNAAEMVGVLVLFACLFYIGNIYISHLNEKNPKLLLQWQPTGAASLVNAHRAH